ncbi:metallophosphoesterase family protein, partial [Lactiplantibacillus plantarum]|uniref:metallophosphoesterase family protein n=1 Tax=Lactiplantibacillus plantarum TaxID=1590 RepID=UPI00223815C4
QQASLDTDMMYGESLPSYFENSFNHVTQGIPSGNDVLNIATISDAHWQEDGATIFGGYTAKSLEHYQWCALSTLYNHADALIALGDNINGDEPRGRLNMTLMHVRSMLQTKYVRTAMFMIRGNHDNGAGHQSTEGKNADEVLNDDDIKNGFGTKLNYYDEVRDGDSLYFYKDFPDKKVRVIGLDSTDIPLEKKDSNGNYAYDTNTAGFQSPQLNWFANKALMLPDNTWQAIVFFHIPFPNAFGQWADDNSFKNYHNAIAILNAFKNGTSVNINDTSNPDFTISGLQADYSKQGKGTLIAVVNGHLHRDDQDTSILNGTPVIEVTTSASFVSSIINDSQRRNTNDEDAWDIISVDTKGHKIHCYRFGRGSDRDFTY